MRGEHRTKGRSHGTQPNRLLRGFQKAKFGKAMDNQKVIKT
jgi:hypothetical protein